MPLNEASTTFYILFKDAVDFVVNQLSPSLSLRLISTGHGFQKKNQRLQLFHRDFLFDGAARTGIRIDRNSASSDRHGDRVANFFSLVFISCAFIRFDGLFCFASST